MKLASVSGRFVVLLWLLPALLFAAWQSSRLFRTQVRDSRLSVIRALLPVALVAFLCAFSVAAPDVFVLHAQRQMWAFFQEASEAIAKIQPDPAQIDPAHPLQLTAEGLARASSLSDRTRRWLSKATITVASGKERPRYLVTIQLTGGPTCTLWFPAGRSYGLYSGVCK